MPAAFSGILKSVLKTTLCYRKNWLIEQAGWKGYREGDVGVHEDHALVLVNYGQATGAELVDLSRRIQASVKEKYGIELMPEVRII